MDAKELGLLLPQPSTKDTKYSRGSVGFVTGSDAYPGAALLGILGAQATACGFVRYVGPRRVADLLLATNPEVVTVDSFAAAGPAQAWVLGSGTNFTSRMATAEQRDNLASALQNVPLAVLDAGALNLIGEVSLPTEAHHILTPHQGELCGLLNRLGNGKFIHPEALDDPGFALETTIRAAEETGQTVLLKGSQTIVASPTGEHVTIGPNSAWLATAGSGDVLAGIIGGIAAQNPQVAANNWLDIARLAVQLHSAAADIAHSRGTVTASTLASAVSQAISERFHR